MRVLVIRLGAFGDLLLASSVFAGLAQQGHEVTLLGAEPSISVVRHDPHLHHIISVGANPDNFPKKVFWDNYTEGYDKVIHMQGIIEYGLQAIPDTGPSTWPPAVRHQLMNGSYLERMHLVAEIPNVPQVRFYPTEGEMYAAQQYLIDGKTLVGIPVRGSSLDKQWWGFPSIVKGITTHYPNVRVVLFGGADAAEFIPFFEPHPNVINTIGKLPIRESLTLAQLCHVVIGPDTGLMHAVSQLDNYKLILLSHVTHEQLTSYWSNTVVMQAEKVHCYGRGHNEAPACHIAHTDWSHCTQDKATGCAMCMASIHPNSVWPYVEKVLERL